MMNILPFWYVTYVDNAGDVNYLWEQVGKMQAYCSEGKVQRVFFFFFLQKFDYGGNDDTGYVLFPFSKVV